MKKRPPSRQPLRPTLPGPVRLLGCHVLTLPCVAASSATHPPPARAPLLADADAAAAMMETGDGKDVSAATSPSSTSPADGGKAPPPPPPSCAPAPLPLALRFEASGLAAGQVRCLGVVVVARWARGEEEDDDKACGTAVDLWVDDGTAVVPVRLGGRLAAAVLAGAGAGGGGGGGDALLGRLVDVVGRPALLPCGNEQGQNENLQRGIEAQQLFFPQDPNYETAFLLAAVQAYREHYLAPPRPQAKAPPPPATMNNNNSNIPSYRPGPAAPPRQPRQPQQQPPPPPALSQPPPLSSSSFSVAPLFSQAAAAAAASAAAGADDGAVLECVLRASGRGGVGMHDLLHQLAPPPAAAAVPGAVTALAMAVEAAVARLQVDGLIYCREGRFFPI